MAAGSAHDADALFEQLVARFGGDPDVTSIAPAEGDRGALADQARRFVAR